jgi:hypothetical protein
MIRSMSEVSGLVLKAARGAGLPLGHAEDLAAATADLTAVEMGLTQLLTALNRAQVGCAYAAPCAIDRVTAGLGSAVVKAPKCPLVWDALVTHAARSGLNVSITWSGADATLVDTAQPASPRPRGPVDIDDTLWAALSTLAAKTYVPATEASRLAGAGAGLTDND